MVAKPMTETRSGNSTDWTTSDAAELYRVESWGAPYFFINDLGHVGVRALDEHDTKMDVKLIIDELCRRGVDLPVLIRFQDVLRAQVKRLNEAFASAIAESNYGNVYRGVYPIKVNQLHEVVDELLDAGKAYGLGLECGSKAELIAALPQVDEDTLLICNGVKDQSMLSLMLAGQRLGQNVVPVIERYSEFDTLSALAGEASMNARLGVRVRLATRGSGRWSESSGMRSKFGLRVSELMRLVEVLEAEGRSKSLVLLHCHIGSQIADIQVLKQAAKEVARIYAELYRRGVGIEFLDLGGGLGINYDKGHLEEDAGINYSLQEYANAVVFSVKEVCDANEVPEPVIVTESGRALTAHHSMLIVPVLGANSKDDPEQSTEVLPESAEPLLGLARILDYLPSIGGSELVEAYHDANERLEELGTLFSLGYVDLEQRALGETIYWRLCKVLLERLRQLAETDVESNAEAPERAELDRLLVDQYLCDFSVFQSMLDHWAIGQPFPIMPVERLGERPGKRAVLVDLTCDSDGKVSHYVTSDADKGFLPVHTLESNRQYYLGFFLMGAYEDIVGDAHNLFGRVTEAHVYADPDEPDSFWIEKIIRGTAIQDMLAQVQYFPNDLHRRMNELVRAKIRSGVVRPTQGMQILEQYMACFAGNTYCDSNDIDKGSDG